MSVPRLVFAWIALLACCLDSAARAQCGVNPGNCCFAHPGRGCIEVTCCQEVCAIDPFCCATSWDALCASRAQANCGVCGVGCGNPAAGNCCAPKTTPACADAPCCTIVCSQDPFCCDVQWDEFCAGAAEKICGACADPCGDPDAGDCCVPQQGPGCNNADCCEGVCAGDPFCCDTQWDAICAQTAQLVCGVCGIGCGNPAAGDCCEAHPEPACSDPACCVPICAADSFCCDVEWDAKCAASAVEFCGACGDQCGSPITGACCVPHPEPACDDAACCKTVCAADPFCCKVEWDEVCAQSALEVCGVCGIGCGVPTAGSCCTPHATPSCADALCCEAICSLDGFCCDTEWDQLCADAAAILCADCGGGCGDPTGPSCCEPHAAPGCSDDRCCLSICIVDPVCCVESWDAICAKTAGQACGSCGPGCGLTASGDCCTPHETPSCSDAACCGLVCALDPFCCESAWDEVCASAALESCPACADACGSPATGDCCAAHTGPACSDAACCGLVCATDPFCCSIEWDAMCADNARTKCELCASIGDLDGDGAVGSADLTILLNTWGTAAADLDGDGTTGPSDLVLLLNNWG
jgi:hypothetical protein